MNSKIISIKTTSAIFLVIVLVTGTIAISSLSSSMTTNAQAQPYHFDGMNDNNNYYQKSYRTDTYYEFQYPSYGKDNYKSSKDSNIDIKNIKCNNINLNINGQGTNNGNTTNGDSTNRNETNYGSKKFNKDDFAFVCINNNNNINVGVGGGNQTVPGNQTISPEPTIPCTRCFEENLDPGSNLIARLAAGQVTIIVDGEDITPRNLIELCAALENLSVGNLFMALASPSLGLDEEERTNIIDCLAP